jgi:DNA-binding NarL/FixJ family response regulator
MARILVVDNDHFWVDQISGSLPEDNIDGAGSYQEAVDFLRRKTYDIAIVDLNLMDEPGHYTDDGLGGEILKLLKSDYPETCRIALTGHTPSAVMEILREYRVADLLLKQNMTLGAVRKVVQAARDGRSAELPPGVRVERTGAQDDLSHWQRLQNLRNDLTSPPRGLSEAEAESHQAALDEQIGVLEQEQLEFERECSDIREALSTASTTEAIAELLARIDVLKRRFGAVGETGI